MIFLWCLNKYQEWFGQRVNLTKLGVTFLGNTPNSRRTKLLHLLHMDPMRKDNEYLDNPIFFLKNQTTYFSFIKERVLKRIEGWSNKLLYRGGRTTFIKSMIQVVSSNTMSSISVPSSKCSNLDAMTRKLWWKEGQLEWDCFLALKC